MSNRSKSKSKSNKKSQKSESVNTYTDEQIEDILQNIHLKRPRTMYTHFCLGEIEKFKNKNNVEKIDLKTFSKELADKWKKLPGKEKEKYKKKFEEDKVEYKKNLEFVRHYLFKDYNDIVSRPPTAYRIFLNVRLREGFEKDKDPKEVKSKA